MVSTKTQVGSDPSAFRPILHAGALAAAVLLSGCATSRTLSYYQEVLSEPVPALAAPMGPRADDEASLAKQPTLEAVLRVALARNPELAEARELVEAAVASGRAAGRLPDLELMVQQWGVPLAEPYALGKAGSLMLGLRQAFPAPGTLDAKSRAALEEARAKSDQGRARALDVIAKVKHAYFEHYRVDREFDVHLEHAELAKEVVELARAHYRTGVGGQEHVLRGMVELTRLHNELHLLEQQRRSTKALLNALMAREPDAQLGPVPELVPIEREQDLAELERALLAARPELSASERGVRRSLASLEAARLAAKWPSFMVGVDYMLEPAHGPHHSYIAGASLSLPWLNPRHRDEVLEAERMLRAGRAAQESVRNAARYELRDGYSRYEASRRSFALIDRELLPQARQSFEASRASFAAGKGGALDVLTALGSYLEVRLERTRALARLRASLADLERAVGIELGQDKGATHE
ncbi:MAG: TolC family protein [Myxococcales bacterium]|nr:TolC family protein [Myxococcales bacterium]